MLLQREPPNAASVGIWLSMDRRLQARVIDESSKGLGVLVEGVPTVNLIRRGPLIASFSFAPGCLQPHSP